MTSLHDARRREIVVDATDGVVVDPIWDSLTSGPYDGAIPANDFEDDGPGERTIPSRCLHEVICSDGKVGAIIDANRYAADIEDLARALRHDDHERSRLAATAVRMEGRKGARVLDILSGVIQ